ncbi:E3 ubiquitin-protein ligase CCNB1IP1 [Chiloscyllium plagiosum]|uniref:E3 ubiquitin-protein ligase CCNB1IP1 n=1 Tax=Chiloscyllium plagiosum TaxID=36176 RepID=UPI001CB83D8C|nr:E3 ubiquitin-protein ligase CCNB1IP1 [Chiloscyllium plagiosum]
MAMCEDVLLCNFAKCRAKLSGFAWVTACSHVFCDQHGSGEFSRSPALCPACQSALAGKLDIVRTELSPSEEYKAMVLSGLRPELILDIASRALAFWTYQGGSRGTSRRAVFRLPRRPFAKVGQKPARVRALGVGGGLLEQMENCPAGRRRSREKRFFLGLVTRGRNRLQNVLMTGRRGCGAVGFAGGLAKFVPTESPQGRPAAGEGGDFHLRPSFFGSPVAERPGGFFTFSPSEGAAQELRQPQAQALGANGLYKMKKM